MNNSTIYISRRCKHCQELLILIHKNKDILNFRIVDIDKEPFPKNVTTVPSMLIGQKILPGQELFKFLTYIINQKRGTSPPSNQEPDMNRGPDMNNQNKKENSDDVVELDGFSNFGDNLGFSLLDDEDNTANLDTSFEFINSDSNDNNNNSPQLSGSGNDYKSEKKNQFDNDYEEMMKSRGAMDSRSDNNQMSMRTF